MSVSSRGVSVPPASPGGSPRWARVYDLGFFQTPVLTQTQSKWEFCMCPLRVESVSNSPPALLNTSSTGFRSQTFWGLPFLVQDPQAEDPNVELQPLAPWVEHLGLWYSSCLWVADLVVRVLSISFLSPSYPSHCGSFFISLIVENLFH